MDRIAEKYLEGLDTEYSYRLAKRMEEHRTNPVLGYRTAGSAAEIATGTCWRRKCAGWAFPRYGRMPYR